MWVLGLGSSCLQSNSLPTDQTIPLAPSAVRSALHQGTLFSTFFQHVPMKNFRPLLSLQCECKRSAKARTNTSKFLLHVDIRLVWMCAFSTPCPHSSQHHLSKEASDKTYFSHGLLLVLFPVKHWWVMDCRSIPLIPKQDSCEDQKNNFSFLRQRNLLWSY